MLFCDLPKVTVRRFKAGDTLIAMGEPVEYVYYLLDGVVNRETITAMGNEYIIGRRIGEQGLLSLVGAVIIYNDWPVAMENFIAVTDCVCYEISQDVCKNYFRKHPELMEEVLQMSANVNVLLMDRYIDKVERNAGAQLCKFLLYYSEKNEDGRILSKEFTNLQIAKFLSLHRVTVANILSSLRKLKCIERHPQGLLLKDIARIAEFAEQKKILAKK